MPSMVLDSDGTSNENLVESMSNDMYETMMYTSIRCQEGDQVTPGFKRPRGVPTYPDETNSANVRNLDRSKIVKMGTFSMMEVLSEGVFKNDEDGVQVFTKNGPEVFDEDKIPATKGFVRDLTSGTYSRLQMKKVFEPNIGKKESKGRPSAGSSTIQSIVKINNGERGDQSTMTIEKRLLVRVSGDGLTFCANKGGEHTSNSI